ncbi:MAG: N-acetylglucosamine-6-sulfatase [Solirubrobacteraceae bacterium]|nr:N-acetylglucosamine-6-sulfatase [Solirubrobacteraceae bacterium]
MLSTPWRADRHQHDRGRRPGGRRPGGRRPGVRGAGLAVLLLGFAALTGWAVAATTEIASVAERVTPSPTRAPVPQASGPARPNIVFVLTDDLSTDLVNYMPQVQALQARGLTFTDYFVSDSLCCPSRASIFTGNFPHDTGVFSNVGADGGFNVFHARGEEQSTFNVALQLAGYRTAMMGKYLNGYLGGPLESPVAPTYVPPGWSEWDVAGWGYPEYNYQLNENGTLHYYGHRSRDYLTDVLARKGVEFIDTSAQSGQPFFLEVATFAPHRPYTPALRDAHLFPGLKAPRPASFDVLPTHPPRWLARHPALTRKRIRRIDRVFRRRAQSVQAVDHLIARIEAALAARHLLSNTYIVFSSDNGLHTGEYRLLPGKLTAFDTDIRVPLVVTGPGVPAGMTTSAMAENVDLAKTFTAMGGTTLAGDGHSLMGLLEGQTPTGWRNAILVEHHGPTAGAADPDAQTGTSGNPTTYEAMRTHRFLYVEYADGEREFYDLENDPEELHNIAGSLTRTQLTTLHTELSAIENCHTGTDCWAAMHVDGNA